MTAIREPTSSEQKDRFAMEYARRHPRKQEANNIQSCHDVSVSSNEHWQMPLNHQSLVTHKLPGETAAKRTKHIQLLRTGATATATATAFHFHHLSQRGRLSLLPRQL